MRENCPHCKVHHGHRAGCPLADMQSRGLFTVPMCAIKLGRQAVSIELHPGYFYDGCNYVKAAELQASTPTLFDLMEAQNEEETPDVAL